MVPSGAPGAEPRFIAHCPRPGDASTQRPAISTGGAIGRGAPAPALRAVSASGLPDRIELHPVASIATAARHEHGRSKVLTAAINSRSLHGGNDELRALLDARGPARRHG